MRKREKDGKRLLTGYFKRTVRASSLLEAVVAMVIVLIIFAIFVGFVAKLNFLSWLRDDYFSVFLIELEMLNKRQNEMIRKDDFVPGGDRYEVVSQHEVGIDSMIHEKVSVRWGNVRERSNEFYFYYE